MLKIWAQPLRRQLVVAIFWFFVLMIAAAVALGLDEFRQSVPKKDGSKFLSLAFKPAEVDEPAPTGQKATDLPF